MKEFPDKLQLDIMWTVATSSAIETRQKPYEIFARLLYQDITNSGPNVTLGKPSK